jgi:hypothetical protein
MLILIRKPIKSLSIPKDVPDEQKLELVSQASHLHPDLNTSLVKKQDSEDSPTPNVVTQRGNETFKGTLTESGGSIKTKEITYRLNSSSKEEEAPISNEQQNSLL